METDGTDGWGLGRAVMPIVIVTHCDDEQAILNLKSGLLIIITVLCWTNNRDKYTKKSPLLYLFAFNIMILYEFYSGKMENPQFFVILKTFL